MTGSRLKILHVFDHSVPLASDYARRGLALLAAQQRLGWQTVQLTTPRHDWPGPSYEEVEGFAFHRTAPVARSVERLPGLNEIALMRATARRIRHIASYEKPDLIHAHAPALNAIAAAAAGKKLGIPTVYEIGALGEDAFLARSVWRARATRRLEQRACRKAEAIVIPGASLHDDTIAAYSRALGRPITAGSTMTRHSEAA